MMMPTKAFILLVLSCLLVCGSSGVAGSSSNVAPDIEAVAKLNQRQEYVTY